MELTIVGLPLGNIKDISLRAIEAIQSTPLVICEDTRKFHRLHKKLQNLGLLDNDYQGEFAILTDYQKPSKIKHLIKTLQKHRQGILVSDAGLPTISDPGFRLINRLLDQNCHLDIIPGPTAAMTSLAISGFSSDRALFLGFLPKKNSKRKQIFTSLKTLSKTLPHTVVIYESPYRIKNTLKDLHNHFSPQTPLVIARELTKKHQQIIRSTLADVTNQQELKNTKGELTLLLRLS